MLDLLLLRPLLQLRLDLVERRRGAYRIGRVAVDKRARRITVPGRLNVNDKPLEYLAVSPAGAKAYETLLELDATGSELNLACILIGLERDPALKPYARFSKTPLKGPPVTLTLAWTEDGQARRMSAAEAILGPNAETKPASVQWIYTGSPVSDVQRQYAADRTGMLIGFIHDPVNIFDVVDGIGIGAYGSIRGNPALPPVGTAIELVIEAVKP